MTQLSLHKEMLRALFDSQPLAVLATQDGRQPYTNLVAFVADEDLKNIYFATKRRTRKHTNIMNNARVSLLIDNRSNSASDFTQAAAVSALGEAVELGSHNKTHPLKMYLAKHPDLEGFVTAPECALIRVGIEKYFLVTRFQEVVEIIVG